MAISESDREQLSEQSEQKIADQTASFGQGSGRGLEFMIEYTRGEADKVASAIKRFAEDVGSFNKNDAISAKYRDEKIGEKRAGIDSRLDLLVDRCQDKIQRVVIAGEKRAALPEIPAAEEALIAQVSAQDIEARQPEQWMELYEETARAGDRVKLSHLRRLLDPRMAEHPAAWEMRKLKHRTEEEVSRDETLAAAESLRASLPMLKMYFGGYLQDVKNVPDFLGLAAVLDEIENHARRDASDVSAQWKAINA